jgi:hypothetical protein
MERHDPLDPDRCLCAWISTGEELGLLDQGGTLSRKGIQCAACAVSGKETVPALFRGGEQLSELRRNLPLTETNP